MTHTFYFRSELLNTIVNLDHAKVEDLANELVALRERRGRLFCLGVGGSAANCSHAVNDFRKLCNIEAYTPTDNVAELTARINDEGWESTFSDWLKVSNLSYKDAILVLSVGGGSVNPEVSINIINACVFADQRDAKVFGIVGKPDGYVAKHGNLVIIIPITGPLLTPITEAIQSVVWHCLVSHPLLQVHKTTW